MPIRSGSRLRQTRKVLHGWKDGEKICLSLEQRGVGLAFNVYKTVSDALKEASTRHLPIQWEDPSAVK